jgi:hypothetical protein
VDVCIESSVGSQCADILVTYNANVLNSYVNLNCDQILFLLILINLLQSMLVQL